MSIQKFSINIVFVFHSDLWNILIGSDFIKYEGDYLSYVGDDFLLRRRID